MFVIEVLADWAASRSGKWSSIATERAVHAITDTVACMIAGANSNVASRCRQSLGDEGGGKSTLIGGGKCSSSSIAACINGTAAHALEIDDNFYPALTHASAVSVPALLALAEEINADGRTIVDAYVIGLEWQAIVSRGVNRSHYSAGWHSTSTIGCIGTAGACARLMGLNYSETVNAVSIAVSMASGLKCQFGTMVKPIQCGLAAQNAVIAAKLAASGVTGNSQALEGKYGFLEMYNGKNHQDYKQALASLENPLAIEEFGVAPKKYACCGSAHKSLDCIDDMRRAHPFDPQDVKEIEIWIAKSNRDNLRYDEPIDGHQAKFSLPYCVAALLKKKRVWLPEFEDSVVADPELQELLSLCQIFVRGVDEKKLSLNIPVSHYVIIRLKDGTVLSKERSFANGTIKDPFTDADRYQKFMNCCESSLGKDNAKSLWDRLNLIVKNKDISKLISKLS